MRARDRAAFDAFVRARLPQLLRFGLALTGNSDDAADLVQEALVRTGERGARLVNDDDPLGYVRR